MKRLAALSAVLYGIIFLAGCFQQPVDQKQSPAPSPIAPQPKTEQPNANQSNDSCRTLGQPTKETTENGPPMTDLASCCDNLTPTFSAQDFDSECKNTYLEQGISGATRYLCLACGDGNCDKKYENNCNCPKDCS
jgi:hypothetical protein